LSPDTLAYILYTSGSSGQPKGVVDEHRNLLHVTKVETNDFHLCAEDRLIFFTPRRYSFHALLNGAAACPIDIKQHGLANLAQWLIQEEITIYSSVASIFRYLVSTLTGDEKFPRLRLINLFGEPVCKRDIELYKEYFSPDCIFVNRLGS